MTKQAYPNCTNPANATNIAKNLSYFRTITTLDEVFMRLMPKLILLKSFITLRRNKTPTPAEPIQAN
jgi:hypothetical protein